MPLVSYRLQFFLSYCVFLIIISQASAQQVSELRAYVCNNDKGNYTAYSTYHTKLNTLLTNLYSDTGFDYGFYDFSYGQNSDRVNAIGLCRGDVKPDECGSCLNDLGVRLTELCPNQKEAVGWHDNCILRYSNRSISGLLETSPTYYLWSPNNATDWAQFKQVLQNLMDGLRRRAASGDSRRKFALANDTAPNFQYIYGLVQCTPDLSEQDCNDCLAGAIQQIPDCCNEKRGGRVVVPSCNIRYETYRFYDPTADASPPSAPPWLPPPLSINNSSSEGKSNTSRTVIAMVVPVVVVVALFIFFCVYVRGRKRKPRQNFEPTEDDDDVDGIQTAESLQFDFDTIRVATNGFSDSDKLGRGGFGAVYRGRLSNGQMIAVKRLARDSSQGDVEFKNEVLLVANLEHRNLVRLIGFCLQGRERLLIYEFVQNKSLDYFIFDPIKRVQLDWERRYKIIVGVARGLLYLHEESRLRIIHRDLKSSNILLDDDMDPKISDFGMARLFVVDQTQGNTNRIVGTYGYMAPEYARYGQFSVKSDVFSFGVLVLEIVTGHKNSGISYDENVEDLLSFAWKNWKEGTAIDIVDPTLNNGSRNEIMRCIHIGLLCVQENVADRPTMANVVIMIDSYSLTLPVPSEPAFFVGSRTRSLPEMQSWEYNSRATTSSESRHKSAQESINEVSITELYPR